MNAQSIDMPIGDYVRLLENNRVLREELDSYRTVPRVRANKTPPLGKTLQPNETQKINQLVERVNSIRDLQYVRKLLCAIRDLFLYVPTDSMSPEDRDIVQKIAYHARSDDPYHYLSPNDSPQLTLCKKIILLEQLEFMSDSIMERFEEDQLLSVFDIVKQYLKDQHLPMRRAPKFACQSVVRWWDSVI
jgi:hypothetical protein